FRPVLLGGGHEIAYGHATGIHQYLAGRQTLGIINFDAHFDIREPDAAGPSSGTGFWQLATESRVLQRPFHYLALGIQPMGNTPALFHTAAEHGVQYVPADAFLLADSELTLPTIRNFIRNADHIYFTTCLDVFSAAHAPGVSATAFNGILPAGLVLQCYREILRSGKVISADIAELNPVYDSDQRTARLAAALVFEMAAAFLGMEH
ncbi:MAG TPA: formimidoylglutamase, partial [Chitinophaga sp.]